MFFTVLYSASAGFKRSLVVACIYGISFLIDHKTSSVFFKKKKGKAVKT